MSDININYSNVNETVNSIKSFVQENIINECKSSQIAILGSIDNSAGDYIEAFKTQVQKEAQVTEEVGRLLISVAGYIKEASDTLKSMDEKYSNGKVK